MEFAKYYDASKIVDEMIKKKEIDCYPIVEGKFDGVYVCMLDTEIFWISRIYKDEDGKYFVEKNKITSGGVIDKLYEQYGKPFPLLEDNRIDACEYINQFKIEDTVKKVIAIDDNDGLYVWDCCKADSLEEAIKIIDGEYEILKIS